MKRAALDPAEHCRHATKAQPLVRACWNRSPHDPCVYCARVEQERQEQARAYEERCNSETYHAHLKRTAMSPYRTGSTLAYWAADLYEDAGCDVDKAVASIAACHAYPEDRKLLEAHVRLMPTRNRDHVQLWLRMLDQLGVSHRKSASDASTPSTPAQARAHAGATDNNQAVPTRERRR
jgi:hypothetical protein